MLLGHSNIPKKTDGLKLYLLALTSKNCTLKKDTQFAYATKTVTYLRFMQANWECFYSVRFAIVYANAFSFYRSVFLGMLEPP